MPGERIVNAPLADYYFMVRPSALTRNMTPISSKPQLGIKPSRRDGPDRPDHPALVPLNLVSHALTTALKPAIGYRPRLLPWADLGGRWRATASGLPFGPGFAGTRQKSFESVTETAASPSPP